MNRYFKQLMDEIDGYLRERKDMYPLDREMIIRLKDHMIGQERQIEGLIQDRENLLLNRK